MKHVTLINGNRLVRKKYNIIISVENINTSLTEVDGFYFTLKLIL